MGQGESGSPFSVGGQPQIIPVIVAMAALAAIRSLSAAVSPDFAMMCIRCHAIHSIHGGRIAEVQHRDLHESWRHLLGYRSPGRRAPVAPGGPQRHRGEPERGLALGRRRRRHLPPCYEVRGESVSTRQVRGRRHYPSHKTSQNLLICTSG